MKHHLPILVLLALIGGSVFSCLSNYWAREASINEDVQNALAMTLKERNSGVVDADTIQTYRNHITIDDVKDTACITVKSVNRGGVEETVFEASAGCSFLTVFASSDQRASGILAFMAVLWTIGSLYYTKRNKSQLVPVLADKTESVCGFGGIRYVEEQSRFITDEGEVMRLTPMQQQLMEMFYNSPSHSLTKQDICDVLWPKKPDASDTLYTLIRRLKPIIEEKTSLRIEVDRGREYILKNK